MRFSRVRVEGEAIYHCMSKTVDGALFFKNREKEVFRKMMAQVADFSGVEVLTYCLMGNHFHILVRVPEKHLASDGELLRRYKVLYPKPTQYQTAAIDVIEGELKRNGDAAECFRSRMNERMHDVSQFMKTLKQRFSTWFNKSHDRFGPLWSDRFKSVLVEGEGYALQTIAAYIDLNPVRAGLVEDPKDYRFSGYAEAVAGNKQAQRAISFLTSGQYATLPEAALASYRTLLFSKGASPAEGMSEIDRQAFIKVVEKQQGRLPIWALLRCRVRYFTEGAILGSAEFVQSHAEAWQRSRNKKNPPKLRSIMTEEGSNLTVIKGVRGSAYS